MTVKFLTVAQSLRAVEVFRINWKNHKGLALMAGSWVYEAMPQYMPHGQVDDGIDMQSVCGGARYRG